MNAECWRRDATYRSLPGDAVASDPNGGLHHGRTEQSNRVVGNARGAVSHPQSHDAEEGRSRLYVIMQELAELKADRERREAEPEIA